MKKDDVPDFHAGDTKAWEDYWGQAEWQEDCRKEEKWESGDTITIGDARKKLGLSGAMRHKEGAKWKREHHPSGEEL